MPPKDLPKYACSLCSRRKVKCDKQEPCSNCIKAESRCIYEAPALHRPRKRAADEDLLKRLSQYEHLMRKHDIDFSHCAHTWIPSELGAKINESDSKSPSSVVGRSQSNSCQPEMTPNLERCLWSNLAFELKHPPIQNLRHKDDPLLHPTPSLESMISSTQPEIYKLHPEPRHIYRFWQIFVEAVNPLIKIVHVPTLQQRILDASWGLANVPRPLTAIMFAIYTLAVTSMSPDECQASFAETRGVLLTRYQTATLRALIAAEFLTTREFEVMQAFVLFLLADPESELTSTLAAAAMRLALKMGLNRESADPKVSFFEKEMRVRLWGQLRGLDCRIGAVSIPGSKSPTPIDFPEVRLPLNVNDADLHPDMTEAPIEHTGPTEMLCVLMKFEVSNWLRSSPTAAKVFENIRQGPVKGKISMELEDGAINELEAIYQEKYFCNWDKRIPLHALTHTMAKLAIARMRFKVHHPRGRAVVTNGEVYMTREESDMLFDSAVTLLEMVDAGIRSKFSSHLFTHMTVKFHMDAYIYVISDLRLRCSGDRVELAWRLAEDIYSEHPELINDAENTFYTALGDLALEAWEARRRELIREPAARELEITPRFIQLLWDRRQSESLAGGRVPVVSDSHGIGNLGPADIWDLDMDYWNDFLRL